MQHQFSIPCHFMFVSFKVLYFVDKKFNKMKNHFKVTMACALFMLANSSPQSGKPTTVRPFIIRPTRTPPPAIVALQTTYGALTNVIASAGNLASSSLDSLANRAYDTMKNAAQNTGQMIDNTAQTVNDGIHSVANALSNRIRRPFREDPSTTHAPPTLDARDNPIFIEF